MPHTQFNSEELAVKKNTLGLVSFVALCLTAATGNAQAIEEEFELTTRWDDKYFGFEVEKPERGRLWKVATTDIFTDGARLQKGDEILEIDGQRVTVKDDLNQILQDSGDVIEVRAKRKQGRDRKTGRAIFRRTTQWEATKAGFDVQRDQIRDREILRVKELANAVSDQTHLLPEVVMKDGHPDDVILRFQYLDDDWLFIEQLTIKSGDQQFVIERDPLTEVSKQVIGDGTVKEWFAINKDDAIRILLTIGTEYDEECIVRMHGKDYYADFTLSEAERASFTLTALLWLFGHQREQDLARSE